MKVKTDFNQVLEKLENVDPFSIDRPNWFSTRFPERSDVYKIDRFIWEFFYNF